MYIKIKGSGNTAQRRGWFVFHFIDNNNVKIPITSSDVVEHNFTDNIAESNFFNLFQQELSGVALTPSRNTSTEVTKETYFIVKIPSVYKVGRIKFKTWSTDGSYFTNTNVSFSRSNRVDSYKNIDNIPASARNTIYESKDFYESLNPLSKTLILQGNEYKKWNQNEQSWSSEQLETIQINGMDELTPLLDRKITTLKPMQMQSKSDILPANSEGKVFSKTIDLNKYFDIRKINVEVE